MEPSTMTPSSSGEVRGENRFLVEISIHCLRPEGIDFERLAVAPKESTWTGDKWIYQFDALLGALDMDSIVHEIGRWNNALIAAGYTYEQFAVSCKIPTGQQG